MNEDALSTYLNDHLAGSTLGVDHARQLEAHNAGEPFGTMMTRVAEEIEEDRDVLVDLMDRLGVTRNPVKVATAWVAEKAGRVKFSGISAGDPELGNFLALETMSLGVEGKKSLWTTLAQIASLRPELAATDFTTLIERAESQRSALEAERLRAADRAFGRAAATTS